MSEFVVAGLLITPFVKAALVAALVFVPLRMGLLRLKIHKWFWHPLLAEGAIYICILAAINIALL